MAHENPPTEMQKKLPDGGTIDTSPMLTNGETRERLPHYADQFWVSPQDEKDLKIGADRARQWLRIPRYWEEHEGSNRLQQFARTHPGMQVPKDQFGAERTNEDLVLVTYSMQQYEEEQAALAAEADAWTGAIDAEEHGYPRDPEGTPLDDREAMKMRARRLHRENTSSGVTGNTPTSGQTLEEVYRRYSDADIEAEEARFRSGNRHHSFDDDAWADFVGRPSNRAGRTGGKPRGKVYAMGDSGLGQRRLNNSQPQGGIKPRQER